MYTQHLTRPRTTAERREMAALGNPISQEIPPETQNYLALTIGIVSIIIGLTNSLAGSLRKEPLPWQR